MTAEGERVKFALEYFRANYIRVQAINVVDRPMQDTQFIQLYEAASERDRMKRALEVAERCLKNIASTLHHNQDSRTAERTLAEISKIMGEK